MEPTARSCDHRRLALALAVALAVAPAGGCGPRHHALNPYAVDTPPGVPEMRLVTPATASTADRSFTVEAFFHKVLVEATWSLYYISDAAPDKGAAIAEELPVTRGSYNWDTAALPEGRYGIYGVLHDAGQAIIAVAPGVLTICHQSAAGPCGGTAEQRRELWDGLASGWP